MTTATVVVLVLLMLSAGLNAGLIGAAMNSRRKHRAAATTHREILADRRKAHRVLSWEFDVLRAEFIRRTGVTPPVVRKEPEGPAGSIPRGGRHHARTEMDTLDPGTAGASS